jgi:site-specific DNA recombinase
MTFLLPHNSKADTQLKVRDAWTVIPGVRKPMVEPEVFEKAQALIERGTTLRVEKAAHCYALAGLVRCGKCGSAMCGTSRRKGSKVYRYYRCNGNGHQGSSRCPGATMPADLLEKAVAEKVIVLATTAPTAQRGAQTAAPTETDKHREARRALDRLRERTGRLFDLFEAAHVDKALFQERMAYLSEERGRLTTSLTAAKRDGAHDASAPGTAAGVLNVVVRERHAHVHIAGGTRAEVSLLRFSLFDLPSTCYRAAADCKPGPHSCDLRP